MDKNIQFKNGSEKIYPNPFWPVNSIYISILDENPTKHFGGTWEKFGVGRTLVGVDTNQSEFNTVKKTGGHKEMQSHEHNIVYANGTPIQLNTGGNKYSLNWGLNGSNVGYDIKTTTVGNGNSQNLQPYITVFFWLRTK